MRKSASFVRLAVVVAFLLSPIANSIYADAQLSGVTGAVNSTVSGVTGAVNNTVSNIGSNLTDTLFNNGTLITVVNGILMKFQLDPYQPLASSITPVSYTIPQGASTIPVSYTIPQGTGMGNPTTAVTLNDPQTIYGTVSSAPYQFTISNFNPGTGSNNLLVVGVSANNAYVTSITFGNTQLTKAVSSFQNNDAELWYLANPTGTGNIVVTMNGATSAVVGAYAFSGVNQASPIAGTAVNFNPLATPSSPTVSITTKYSNDQVVDLPSIYGGQLLGSPTCAQQWDANIPSAITGASSTAVVSSPGTVTCSWTASHGGDQWDDVAVEIRASGTTPVTVPSAPTGLTATGGNAQVSLSWSAPSSNGGTAITGYNIYRGASPGSEGSTPVATTGISALTYTDTTVTNGQTYYYVVKAVNSAGPSAASNEASATPVSSGQATITVNTVDLCGNPITGMWTIARYTNGNTATQGYTPATFALASGTTYIVHVGNYGSDVFDHWMNGNTTSYYAITLTQNTVLTAYYSTGSTCTPPPTVTVPGSPTGLTATAISPSQVNLSWIPPSNNGGSAITGYNIYRGAASGGEAKITSVPASSTTYSDTTVTSGQTYFYEVTAVNSAGESAKSNEASVTQPAATVPSAPTGLTVTDGNGQASLSWTPPSNNGGSPITNYKIYRSTSSGTETILATIGNVNSYTDTGLTNGATYYYKVTAVNSVGESAKSNEASVTDSAIPQPPTGLAATAVSSSQINLSWTAPASNGGSAITGYKIERSPDNTNWSVIASNTGSTSTSYSDAGLVASTTYYYRVSATNSVGASQPSSTASATTSIATHSISQTQSGLVASDSLTNETASRSQLLSSSGYWRYQGDAQAEGAPYSVTRDSQGLHIGIKAQSEGRWAGFFAESPNHNAQVWHAVISTPIRNTPSSYYDNALYVQTSDGNINYVSCGSLTNSQATIWVVISATGNTQEVTQFNRLWEDNSPNQSLTRDCTIITNGSNSLKVYLDGTLVYQSTSRSLQMPVPFNAYLEEESSYSGQMLTDTFQNYYVATSQYVTVSNLPSSTSSVNITNPSGTVLATSTGTGGTATLDIGQYTLPISGAVNVYGSSNSQLATRPGTIYGGDMYKFN